MELRRTQNHGISFKSTIQTRVFRIEENGRVTSVKDAKRFYNGVRELGMYLEKHTPIGNNPRPDVVRAFREAIADYKEPGYGQDEGSLLAYGDTKTLTPFIFTGPEAEAIFKAKSLGSNPAEAIRRFVKGLVDPLTGFQFKKQEKPIGIQIYTAPSLNDPKKDTLLDIVFAPFCADPLSAGQIREMLRPKVLANLVPEPKYDTSFW